MAKGEPPYADVHPMRVLFLIPKNLPPTLDGEFSKPFKEFVAACLKKDPEERFTAKELLKQKFFKNRGKTSCLVELIERRKKFLENESSSVGEGDDDTKPSSQKQSGPKWEWDDTIKQVPEGLTKDRETEDMPAAAGKKEPAAGVSPPPSTKETKSTVPPPKKKSDNKRTTEGGGNRKKEKKKTNNKKPAPAQSTALLNVIYPTLGKLAKNTKDDHVIQSLNQLKTAFDQAEATQPGITHNFIAQVIDTLKRN